MKQIIGIILLVLGLIVIIFGGVCITIYFLYDIISNWDTLTRLQIFWEIIAILFRDMFTVSLGVILMLTGKLLAD